ncbi:hypothetical protein [Clostridium arbusti]|uniref:hypothetical protein n=1 Tax=Clostridium arbusti TaxID=1137848 RepID=UPI0002880F5D|nr:hypothetical protein [Clostridium arbusti]
MDNIKTLIQLGILVPIIWVASRNILFAKKRDKREILALFNALKTTVISAIFVLGLIIILNLLNGITSISIMYIFIIALICCFYFVILYKLNLNTEFSIFNIFNKEQNSKLIWNIFSITMVADLLALIGIFISYKYFDFKGLKVLTISAYVLAFISDYFFCRINAEGI